MLRQPLEGIRVLELATGVPGPFAGKLLADYGADVIKAEPPEGDGARRHGPFPNDVADPEQSALFLHLNTNKRGIVLDPSTPAGAALVRRLTPSVDVIIESFPPGRLTSWGLGYDDLRFLNPRIVVVSVTAFGQDGPYASMKGEEIVAYAMGGPMHATGVAEREPVKLAGNVIQYQCGNVAAFAALAAWMVARSSERSVHVDISQFEVQAATIDRRATFHVQYAYNGRVMGREQMDAKPPLPSGAYITGDGVVQIGTAPIWLPRMLAVLDDPDLNAHFARPDWFADPDTPGLVEAVLYPWLLERTATQAMEDGQHPHRWPITSVRAPVEVLDDEHFRERGFFVEADHPAAGSYLQPGAPFRMEDGWRLRRAAPTLGQHQTQVESEAAATSSTTVDLSVDLSVGVALGVDATGTPGTGSAPSPRPVPAAPRQLPLAGLRVVDLTVVWAGPCVTMFLADLGAEVIRVDNPGVFPNNTRGALPRPTQAQLRGLAWMNAYPDDDPGERPWNRTALFNNHARGKKSATARIERPLGREAFLRLIAKADVFIENNAVGVLPKLKLDWDVLSARNPRLIVMRMPAMGLTGSKAEYLGYGTHFEALCGFTAIRGYADAEPATIRPTFHMDPASGASGALAVLCALLRREETGRGGLIEMAQTENMVQHIGEYLVDAGRTRRVHGPTGNRHRVRAPQGAYRCHGEDRWVAISVGDDVEWAGLWRAMGYPVWATEPRFATRDGRIAHHDELDERITEWTHGQDRHDVFRACQQEGVPCGPVMDEVDCATDPHLSARGFFRENGSEEVGTHRYPGHAWKWDGPALAWGPICRMGNENDDVWRGIVGMTGAEYAEMAADGHLSRDYLGPDGRPY